MIRAAAIVAVAVTGVVALATAPALHAAAGAMDMAGSDAGPKVSILFGSLTPVKVDALAGEPVDWSNDSVRDHTISADDGSYDSGTLRANAHFSRIFSATGTYAYHCRLHPYIRGEIDVHRLLLDRPTAPAGAGRNYPLTCRAALASGSTVAIEFDSGSGWQRVADATVGADRRFSAQVTTNTAAATGRSAVTSRARPSICWCSTAPSARIRAAGGSRQPPRPSPGATVVLQLYSKERFGWWPVAVHRLDKSSRTTFRVPNDGRARARVVLTLPDGATPLATSAVLRSHS